MVMPSTPHPANSRAPGQRRVACPESTCNVWRQNLKTGTAESAPDPDHLVYTQIGSAVDGRGVVYYDRTLASCGNAEIRRWDGTNDSLALRLPPKFAYQYSYLAKKTTTLYFDLGHCHPAATATDDIYKTTVHPPGTP